MKNICTVAGKSHQGIILGEDGIETEHLRCGDAIPAVRGQHVAAVGGIVNGDDLL